LGESTGASRRRCTCRPKRSAAWESIYGRILRVVPAVFECEPCDRAGRGAEKRRSAVEYLRQHMHELRPHRAPDSGASRSPHRLDPLGERDARLR
jgi:hypothetical protein